jgi:acyl-CoA synthetase (AMP-forming)/AMP-acid ligase II
MTESVSLSSTHNEDPLTINLQSSITVLKAQPIISGKTNYQFVNSVGILYPDVEAHVVREDGSEADVNEVGELYIRSECVALGYWNDEKATQEAFVDGWLRTGDLVRVDKDGYFS